MRERCGKCVKGTTRSRGPLGAQQKRRLRS